MEDALISLINRIVELSPAVWEVAVRQAYIEGVGSVLALLFFVAISFFSFRLAMWGKREFDADKNDEWGIPSVFIGGVVFIVSLAAALISAEGALSNFLNPHYAAIKLLLKLAGVE